MDIQQEIIGAINALMDKGMPLPNVEVPTVILAIEGDKYKINLNGSEYYAKNGLGVELTVGQSVWVKSLGNSSTNYYIIAIR